MMVSSHQPHEETQRMRGEDRYTDERGHEVGQHLLDGVRVLGRHADSALELVVLLVDQRVHGLGVEGAVRPVEAHVVTHVSNHEGFEHGCTGRKWCIHWQHPKPRAQCVQEEGGDGVDDQLAQGRLH